LIATISIGLILCCLVLLIQEMLKARFIGMKNHTVLLTSASHFELFYFRIFQLIENYDPSAQAFLMGVVANHLSACKTEKCQCH
jgi:hypothetical protein